MTGAGGDGGPRGIFLLVLNRNKAYYDISYILFTKKNSYNLYKLLPMEKNKFFVKITLNRYNFMVSTWSTGISSG